jgi:protein-S-isoprenylcysteine O-methyltransferase Ste14
MTAVKTILFILFVPVLLLWIYPFRLMSSQPALFSFGVLRWLALPIWLAAAVGMTWCAYDFTVKGRGTPAPTEPPRELVAEGLYRYVRNPMYISGFLLLLGHIFWFPSLPILVSAPLFLLGSHLFVTLYEEPALRKKFGASYEEYLRNVPRWIPRV